MESVSQDLQGLKALVAQEYTIQSQSATLREEVEELGCQRRMARLQAEKERAVKDGRARLTRKVALPARVTDLSALDALIQQLQAVKKELELYSEIEVTITVEE